MKIYIFTLLFFNFFLNLNAEQEQYYLASEIPAEFRRVKGQLLVETEATIAAAEDALDPPRTVEIRHSSGITYLQTIVHIAENNRAPYAINCNRTNETVRWLNARAEPVEWDHAYSGRLVVRANGGVLEFTKILAADSGLYICQVDERSHVYQVYVYAPAEIAYSLPFVFDVSSCDEWSTLRLLNSLDLSLAETKLNHSIVYDTDCSDVKELYAKSGKLKITVSILPLNRKRNWEKCLDDIKCELRESLHESLRKVPFVKTAFSTYNRTNEEANMLVVNRTSLSFVCPAGYRLYKTVYCVACQPGSYYPHLSRTESCFRCEHGFYQALAAQKQCEPCDQNYTTNFQGAISADDCVPKKPKYHVMVNEVEKPNFYVIVAIIFIFVFVIVLLTICICIVAKANKKKN